MISKNRQIRTFLPAFTKQGKISLTDFAKMIATLLPSCPSNTNTFFFKIEQTASKKLRLEFEMKLDTKPFVKIFLTFVWIIEINI